MKAAKKHLTLALIELKDKLAARTINDDTLAVFIAETIQETLTQAQIKKLIIQLLQ